MGCPLAMIALSDASSVVVVVEMDHKDTS